MRLIAITVMSTIWGHSSAGRAPAWHAGSQRFESAWLHSRILKNLFIKLKFIEITNYYILNTGFKLIIKLAEIFFTISSLRPGEALQ